MKKRKFLESCGITNINPQENEATSTDNANVYELIELDEVNSNDVCETISQNEAIRDQFNSTSSGLLNLPIREASPARQMKEIRSVISLRAYSDRDSDSGIESEMRNSKKTLFVNENPKSCERQEVLDQNKRTSSSSSESYITLKEKQDQIVRL